MSGACDRRKDACSVRTMPQLPLTRDRLLELVREVAARNGGKSPGMRKFAHDSGIRASRWQGRLFRDWNSVIAAAGLQPNELSQAYDDETLLTHLATLTHELGQFPKVNDLRVAHHARESFPSEKVFRRVGSGMNSLRDRTAEWTALRPDWSDVARILAVVPTNSAAPKRPELASSEIHGTARVTDSYLPPVVACLVSLSRADAAISDELRRGGRDSDVEFEWRVGIAWALLGLRVDELGQGRGRVADGIAKSSPHRDWALIHDAKVRRSGFRIGAEDRKFREYVETHEAELRREGYRNVYFAVVSSHFDESDLDKARELVRATKAKSCVLVEASALTWLVEEHLRAPLDRDVTCLERKLAQTRILSRETAEVDA